MTLPFLILNKMQITNSPDITNLLVGVTWDISNTLPQVILTNLSTGSGLANCTWAFVTKSPTGSPIHSGIITSPDITGVWTTYTMNDGWPRPDNKIEFSGAQYSFYVIVKDSAGNIYTSTPQLASIFRPNGNTDLSKNTFGIASSNVKVKCQEARIFFQDTTNSSYKGLIGKQISSVLKVLYPIDETGVIPTPFIGVAYSTALVAISYSSNNYQFLQATVYDYDLGNNTTLRIKYQTLQTFGVWCNIDFQPLVCEVNKLIDSVENGNCSDVASATKILGIVNSKMVLAFMGVMQPLTGIDVPSLIEEIKTIGGFDCNCCSSTTGIIPTMASVIDGYNFTVNKLGGDIHGYPSVNGSNIIFNLADISYVVTVNQSSPSQTTAFSFTPTLSNDGYIKTYGLNIDGGQLATDMLNTVKNNSGLVNLFNSIVTAGSGNFTLLVDGGCIFQSTASCNYTFATIAIGSTVLSILTGIMSNGVTIPLSFSFNTTNIAALATYLNSKGIGTFTTVLNGDGTITISSATNTNNLLQLTYLYSSTNYIAYETKSCTGYLPISANSVVQKIINYVCGITDNKLYTSQDYLVSYIDTIDNTSKQVKVLGGSTLNALIIALLDNGIKTINYIQSISALNCANVVAMFPQAPLIPMVNSDYFLVNKSGFCAREYPTTVFTKMLQFAATDANALSAFCNLIQLCANGQTCQPYNIFNVNAAQHSPSDNQQDLVITFSHPAATSNKIRYARIDNTTTPVYTTINNIVPGASPYTIPNLPVGQYIIGMTPNYADGRICAETTKSTLPCIGINSFSAALVSGNFVINYNAISSVPKVQLVISYPNGGSFSQNYTNNGNAITITPPTGVYGNYFITIAPVCNEATGFIGQATSPAVIAIANPSIITQNYTLSPSYNFSITSVTGTGIPSLPPTGTTGNVTAHHTAVSGNVTVQVTGTIMTTTKIDIYVNGILTNCVAVPSSGTYNLGTVTALETDDLRIAIDSGSC